MDQREQFLADRRRRHFTMRELCERYAISRKTGYKWVARVAEQGRRGLQERSRALLTCQYKTSDRIAALIVAARQAHPDWGRSFVVKRVTDAGTIRFQHRLLFLANALDTNRVGLEEIDDGIWSI